MVVVPLVKAPPPMPPVQVPAPIPSVGEANKEPLFKRLQKQHPSIYEGSTDPLVAEQWMAVITSILNIMRLEGNEKVAYANYMLRNDARIWWSVVSQIQDVRTLSWKQLQVVFNEKYLSDIVRSSKMEEFGSLIQGRMTVTEYTQIFDRLDRFEPEIVPTDRACRNKFIWGLNNMVARDDSITMSSTYTTYAQVVERAIGAERTHKLINRENTARRESRRVAQAASGTQGTAGSADLKRRAQDVTFYFLRVVTKCILKTY